MRSESHGPADRYTHGHHASVVAVHGRRTAADSAAFLLPHLRAGDDLLDVGCGPGSITLDLAERVAPGWVLGLDAAETVVRQARSAAADRGDTLTRFAVGDVYDLGLPDGSFDVVYAHQVLQHLTDPVAALREMARVTKPGGLIAVRDADYATFAWYPDSSGLTRWLELYHHVARANGAEPDAGRRLGAWARRAGLTNLQLSTSTWSYHDPDARAVLAEGWAERLTHSALGEQARELGLADRAELEALARAWRNWATEADGWFVMVHGEVLARVFTTDIDAP